MREDRGTIGLIQGTLGRQGNIKIVQVSSTVGALSTRTLGRLKITRYKEKIALLSLMPVTSRLSNSFETSDTLGRVLLIDFTRLLVIECIAHHCSSKPVTKMVLLKHQSHELVFFPHYCLQCFCKNRMGDSVDFLLCILKGYCTVRLL